MRLRDLFSPSVVELNLASSSKQEVLGELVKLLGGPVETQAKLIKTLRRRENLGSTGIGKGIAIPHCRTTETSSLLVAYGRKPEGLDFSAIDGAPVHDFFVIVAPPVDVSNDYLQALGKIAQFAKDPGVPRRLRELNDVQAFLSLLEERG